MNDTPPNPTKPVSTATPPARLMRVTVPLELETYHQIHAEISELSLQLGFEVTFPKFLRKTIVDNWKVQLERFRKLDPALRKTRP